jgi:cardiolipin synthase
MREPIIHGFHLFPPASSCCARSSSRACANSWRRCTSRCRCRKLAKWKTTFQLVALGALILAGATPDVWWVHATGLVSLWAAAILTGITGWDYLRIGLKHMD